MVHDHVLSFRNGRFDLHTSDGQIWAASCLPGHLAAYAGMALWCGLAASPESELGGRILLGLVAGSAEVLAPLTIADIFFLHWRGLVIGGVSLCLPGVRTGGANFEA